LCNDFGAFLFCFSFSFVQNLRAALVRLLNDYLGNVHARSCVSRSLSWLLLAPRRSSNVPWMKLLTATFNTVVFDGKVKSCFGVGASYRYKFRHQPLPPYSWLKLMLSVNVHARSCVSRSLSWLLLAPRRSSNVPWMNALVQRFWCVPVLLQL
jgi:hypothetical protein